MHLQKPPQAGQIFAETVNAWDEILPTLRTWGASPHAGVVLFSLPFES
jgi:hypothetical protein